MLTSKVGIYACNTFDVQKRGRARYEDRNDHSCWQTGTFPPVSRRGWCFDWSFDWQLMWLQLFLHHHQKPLQQHLLQFSFFIFVFKCFSWKTYQTSTLLRHKNRRPCPPRGAVQLSFYYLDNSFASIFSKSASEMSDFNFFSISVKGYSDTLDTAGGSGMTGDPDYQKKICLIDSLEVSGNWRKPGQVRKMHLLLFSFLHFFVCKKE